MNTLKESPFLVTLLLFLFVGIVMLLPTKSFLQEVVGDKFKGEYLDLICKMGVLFIASYYLIQKLDLQLHLGMASDVPWKFKYLNLIPVYLFTLGILSVVSKDFASVSAVNIILLFVACLFVGFAEELLFRGVIQSLFLKKHGVLFSVLMSSLSFGLFHLVNLVKNDSVLGQVLVQVVFAYFIGFFFGMLLLKTGKLIPIAVTHGLINFFFSLQLLPAFNSHQNSSVSIAPIIIFLPLLISGVFIYRSIPNNILMEELSRDING